MLHQIRPFAERYPLGTCWELTSCIVLAVVLCLSSSGGALGHSGRTDSGLTNARLEGCHSNQKRRVYECHHGPLAGQIFKTKKDAEEAPIPTPPITKGPFNRKQWGNWINADGDCKNTRQEVLIRQSLVPAGLNSRNCRVIAGRWADPYTGETFTDPEKLSIDHLVSLREAHESGAFIWDAKQKKEYFNDLEDPEALVAVSKATNSHKGDGDPAVWLPTNQADVCQYVEAWVRIKKRWNLTMDKDEKRKIQSIRLTCGVRK